MKCRAAVIRGVGQAWEIREIDLDPPRSGEVLVRMAVAGICHSDDHLFTGDVVPTPEVLAASGQPAPDWFPLLGGHEGAGVVEEVGPGVTAVRPGTTSRSRSSPRAAVAGFVSTVRATSAISAPAYSSGRCPLTERAAGISATKTCWPMVNSALSPICGAVREVRHQDRRRDSFPCSLARVVRCQHRLGLRDGVGRHRARGHRGSHWHRRRRDERLTRRARCRRNLCRRGGSG